MKDLPDENLEIEIKPSELKEKAADGTELTVEQKLAQATERAKEAEGALARSRAEFQAEFANLQKRAQRDIEQAHRYALEQFVKALIPVVDSLQQGLATQVEEKEKAQAMFEGMELTLKMLLDTLKKFSVEALNPLHQPFDPALHEAMVMQPTTEHAPNTVVMVVQPGYTLHGRLIRPARVIVAKAP